MERYQRHRKGTRSSVSTLLCTVCAAVVLLDHGHVRKQHQAGSACLPIGLHSRLRACPAAARPPARPPAGPPARSPTCPPAWLPACLHLRIDSGMHKCMCACLHACGVGSRQDARRPFAHAAIPPYTRGLGKYKWMLSKEDLGER
eukprot:362507-Chlamydomonas_euryale.AAC.17